MNASAVERGAKGIVGAAVKSEVLAARAADSPGDIPQAVASRVRDASQSQRALRGPDLGGSAKAAGHELLALGEALLGGRGPEAGIVGDAVVLSRVHIFTECGTLLLLLLPSGESRAQKNGESTNDYRFH